MIYFLLFLLLWGFTYYTVKLKKEKDKIESLLKENELLTQYFINEFNKSKGDYYENSKSGKNSSIKK